MDSLRVKFNLPVVVSMNQHSINFVFTARDCGALMPPTDGSVEHPTTTFMSTATYSCNSGFTVEGDSTRTCQANGTWSGSDPTCRQCKSMIIVTKYTTTLIQPPEMWTPLYKCMLYTGSIILPLNYNYY